MLHGRWVYAVEVTQSNPGAHSYTPLQTDVIQTRLGITRKMIASNGRSVGSRVDFRGEDWE